MPKQNLLDNVRVCLLVFLSSGKIGQISFAMKDIEPLQLGQVFFVSFVMINIP